LGGLYLIIGPLLTPRDGDLYWQRWLGNFILTTHHLPRALGNETFTASGAPWVPQEWLFSVIVAVATNQHWFFALQVAVSSIPGLILLLLYFRCTDDRAATGIAILLCGIAMLESFGVRAQVLGWGAFAAFLYLLERRDRWYYAAIAVTVLWANLHASVALAPAVVAARLLGTLLDGGPARLGKDRDLLMLPLTALATCASPLGWRLPAFALSFVGSPIRHYILEWQPPSLNDTSFLLGAVPLGLAILFGGKATLLQRKRATLMAALLFAAALGAERNVPLFAIAAAPLAAVGIAARWPRLRDLNQRLAPMLPAAAVLSCVAFAFAAAAMARVRGNEPSRLPVSAIAQIGAFGGEHHLFCEDFTWCSVALAYPGLHVFIDGRCDAYPLPVWRQYTSALAAGESWSRPLMHYGVDVVVVKDGSRFAHALANSAQWRRSFADRGFLVYRRA
jgi:hypothetical protein